MKFTNALSREFLSSWSFDCAQDKLRISVEILHSAAVCVQNDRMENCKL